MPELNDTESPALIDAADLRDQLVTKLQKHRTGSTRMGHEYKNPVRRGYDIALTEVLALLGVDATEKQ